MRIMKPAVATLLSSTIIVTNPALAADQVIFRYNPKVVQVQAMTVGQLRIPDLYVGETFSARASATGGIGQLTWSYTGTLPAGVSFSADGVLSGRPTAAGSFGGITFIATDEPGSQTSYNNVSIPVYAQLAGGNLHDVLGIDENQELAIPATGGKAPLSFSLASGSLPSGMSISGGSVSGTPNATNVYEGTIIVRDANGRTANIDVNLSVFSILNATATFGDAYVGEAYSGRFRATGGSKDYTWTVDNLPNNLSVNESTGAVTGSVTAAGSNAITGNVTDGYEFKSVNATINAFNLPDMASKIFVDPYVGTSYADGSAPAVSGGKAPLTYTASGLPAGLSINASTGAVTGNPSSVGVANATISVADANGKQDSGSYQFETRAALTLAAKTYADPYVGTEYSAANGAAPTAAGGKTPYSWSASGLPAGLNIAPSTGVISGNPTSATATSATITLADANSKSVSRTYAFAPRGALALADKVYADPYVGTAYAAVDGAAPVASGGKAPYTWSATGLPSGMAINASTGIVSGTPTAATATTAVITLKDSNNLSISKNYAFNSRAAMVLAAKTYPNPYVGTAYSATDGAAPNITGGLAPYTWSAASLPAGLVMDASTGVISGTPTSATATTATVTVKDANNKQISRTYAFAPRAALALAAKTYPDPYVGTAYAAADGAAPTASGGLAPYTWTATSLPAGMNINPTTGVVSGTPTSATATTATVTITDANSKSVSRTYAFAPRGTLALAAKTYADPYVRTAYAAADGAAPTASGGKSPYTWSATGLPAGLAMNGTTGVISGTPTSTTATTATVTVKDANNKSISRTYAFTPRAALALATKTYPDPYVGTAYTASEGAVPTASGGEAPYTWSATGLPAGLTMNSAGVISGTPTSTSAATATVTIKDANNKSISRTYAFTPRAALAITTTLASPVKMTTTVSASATATGGKTGYTYSATGLPTGVSINASSGAITGKPTATGNFSTVITVTDANGKTKTVSKSIVSETGEVVAAMAGGNGAITLQSLFTSSVWTSDTPKVVNLASGQIRGTTTATDAVTVGTTAWGGTLTFNVAGEIQGKAGAANSGAGGNGFNANIKGSSSQKVIVKVTGAVRGGGGGGGKGGAGGAGGATTKSSTSSDGPRYTLNSYQWAVVWYNGTFLASPTVMWNGTTYAGPTTAPSGGWGAITSFTSGGYTFTRGNVKSQGGTNQPGPWYYEVTRSGTTTTTVNGGAGGAGGAGGRGQGYTLAVANGTAGDNGATVSGGAAGGKGGTGGKGGAWAAAGSTGGTGATGVKGTANGAAGKAGVAGGAAGFGIVNAANMTLTNSGTINGQK